MSVENLFGLERTAAASPAALLLLALGAAVAVFGLGAVIDRRVPPGGRARRVALVVGGVILLLALLLASASAHAAEDAPPALLFVITGQSNAAEQGTAGELSAAARAPVGGAWYYAPQHTKQTRAVALQPYGGVFGVELSFARAVRAATGREVVIAKVYRGGTSIIAWSPEYGTAGWRYDMAQVGHGTTAAYQMYPKVLKVARDAAASYTAQTGRPVEFAGLVYIQVERDSKYLYGANRYEGNLTRLIGALRAQWNAPGLPAVFIDSHTNLGTGGPIVHDAVTAVARDVPGAAWVEVRNLPKKSATHFSSAGVTTLGERLAAAWIALAGYGQ